MSENSDQTAPISPTEVIDPPPPSSSGASSATGAGRRRKRSPDVDGGSPPPPMAGGPPEEAKADEAKAKAEAGRRDRKGSPRVGPAMAMDPDAAAAMLCGILDQAYTMLADSRYGAIIVDDKGTRLVDAMAPKSQSKAMLIDATAAVIRQSGKSVSPVTAMLMLGAVTYALPLGGMEMAHRKIKRARGG